MQSVTATYRNGRIELTKSVDWPDGTPVEVMPLELPDAQKPVGQSLLTSWPEEFFDRLREDWGDEPFERPPQGEFEEREDW
jgi:hypothetical protein